MHRRDGGCFFYCLWINLQPPNCPRIPLSQFGAQSTLDTSGDPNRVIGTFSNGGIGLTQPPGAIGIVPTQSPGFATLQPGAASFNIDPNGAPPPIQPSVVNRGQAGSM